jgi:hypothetical protein
VYIRSLLAVLAAASLLFVGAAPASHQHAHAGLASARTSLPGFASAAGAPPAWPLPGGAAAADARQNLLRLEPFIGGRWVAEGVLSGGHRYSAERRYEWDLDRRFIRIRQTLTVDSVTVDEESVIGWDPSASELRFWSFASDGSFAEGRERPAEGDNRWIFEGRTIGGSTGEWRATTLLLDPGSFSVLLEVRNGGDYQPLMTMAYRRIDDPAPAPADTTAAVDTTAVRTDAAAARIDTLAAGAAASTFRRMVDQTEPMDQKPRIRLTQLSHGAG